MLVGGWAAIHAASNARSRRVATVSDNNRCSAGIRSACTMAAGTGASIPPSSARCIDATNGDPPTAGPSNAHSARSSRSPPTTTISLRRPCGATSDRRSTRGSDRGDAGCTTRRGNGRQLREPFSCVRSGRGGLAALLQHVVKRLMEVHQRVLDAAVHDCGKRTRVEVGLDAFHQREVLRPRDL